MSHQDACCHTLASPTGETSPTPQADVGETDQALHRAQGYHTPTAGRNGTHVCVDVKGAGEEKEGNPRKVPQREPVLHLHLVPPNRAPHSQKPDLHCHLPTSGGQAEPEVLVVPHEDVLLQADDTRPLPVCIPGDPLRLQTQPSKGTMAVSSLPKKFSPRGFTTFPGQSRTILATKSEKRPEELVRKLATLPAPVLHQKRLPLFCPLTTFLYHAQRNMSP